MKKIILTIIFLACTYTSVNAEENLTNIVITSSRIAESVEEITTSTSVLTQEDIEAAGYSSIPELLRTVGAISVSNTGGEGKQTTLRVRGEEGYRTLILIDGVEVSDPTIPQVATQLQHLLLNGDIKRIEILRGPQGFIYGADAGGVVNIFTKQGVGAVSGSTKLEIGSFETKRLSANVFGGNQNFDYFFSVGDSSTEGFNARVDDTSSDNDGYDNLTLHGKLGLSFSDESRLQLVVRDVDGENEFDNCYTAGFERRDNCTGEFDQTIAKLSFDFNSDRLSQHIAYSYTDIKRETFTEGESRLQAEGDISKIEYWGHLGNKNSRIVFGFDLEEEGMDRLNGSDLSRDQLGLFVEYKGDIDEKLFFNIGLRQDDNDDFDKYVSQRFSFAYLHRPNTETTLKYRASYGTGFRAPSLSEIAYNDSDAAFGEAANTVLEEEISEGFDIGFDVLLKNGTEIKITYFDQIIEDEIYFDLSSYSGYLQETGDTKSKGLELSAEIPLTSSWHVYTNYTYNDTKDRDGNRRIRRPRHLANAGIQYFSADNKFTIRNNFRLSRDSEDEIFGVGRVELDDYVVVDVNILYELTNRLTLTTSFRNLFDEEYQEVNGYNSPKQSAYLSLTYNL